MAGSHDPFRKTPRTRRVSPIIENQWARGIAEIRFAAIIAAGLAAALALGGCSSPGKISSYVGVTKASLVAQPIASPRAPASRAHLNGLIDRYAALHGLPSSLVHRVVQKESGYNPAARNGPYYGLMQISHATAQSMGYRGAPAGLLDAETNLRYAVKYLAGAYLVADNSQDQAIRFYQSGYYYHAKRAGLLEATGLR